MDFKVEIVKILKNKIESLSEEEIFDIIEIPPNSDMGDFAFPCFKLSKTMRKSPQIIATELCDSLQKPDFISNIKVLGGYVNFYLNNYIVIKQVLDKVLLEKENYCKKEPKKETVIVEYSSPNIAKPFHIGHIRTTVIGHALYKLYKYMGYNTVGINHLGDYGTQFGKLIVAYKKWGDMGELKQEPIKTLLKLYVKFHKEEEKDTALTDEARACFKKLEEKDEEAVRLWTFFREESLKEFSKVYDMLGIKFDSYAGESFYSDKMPDVIEELEEKNLLQDSKGARVVDLEQYDLGVALVQKSDGSTLYLTRDIAAAMYRKKTYDFYKNIYVVGSQQILHFKQFKKIIELMGHDYAKDCIHVPFGMVALEYGTLSTRKGNVVFLEDVLNNAIEKTRTIIEEKNPNLQNIDELSKQIGIGAVVFQELSNSRTKDYVFSMEKTLSFEGETGPYVQYTHARACSVIRKSNGFDYSNATYKTLADNEDAVSIIKILATFDDVLEKAVLKNEPHHIARYVLDLSQTFNKFYHSNSIANVDDEDMKKDRLALTKAVTYAISCALNIFGIKAPERM
ncbi:MAG: arginine--tRNA ligase [Peptoanaerobacter stomatis]|uniref:arginine--tRNA ligase n=1 Tax=Peptoanaerobacter stomatis TaxID=796937 RepID=UPI003FA12F6F